MSSRGLVKSMLVIGSAQAVNIVISILRMKILALLLGPSGIGLLGIYSNLQGMVTNVAGLGMGSSGVRQIASVRGEEKELSRVRRVLLAAHATQGALAMLGVWLLRVPIAEWVMGDATQASEIGLIGIAIFLGLMATAQTTLLQGMRRIGDLGRVTVLSAFVGTVAGLIAVWLYGQAGLIWFILVQPLSATLVALRYTRRLPHPTIPHPTPAETWQIWKPLARLGMAFMLGGLATAVTLLVIRSRITQEMGLDAAGQFAAAWGITMTYVGFLLGAMGADYYPRLTEVINDKAAATQLMNDQMQLGLAIGGPILLLLIGLAPWVISLLYSSEFGPAAELLQWQTVGNLFKLASWPLGFSLAAAGRGKTFLFVEINFNVLFLLMLWPNLDKFGLISAGPAFMIAYILHFGLLSFLVHRFHGFRWQALSLWLLAIHALLALVLLVLAQTAPFAATITSPFLAIATGVFGVRVMLTKIGPAAGSFTTQLIRAYAAIGWPVRNTL